LPYMAMTCRPCSACHLQNCGPNYSLDQGRRSRNRRLDPAVNFRLSSVCGGRIHCPALRAISD
jgi:hypothetical protein